MHRLTVLLALLLVGCSTQYISVPIEIFNNDQYLADVSECRQAAVAYHPQLHILNVVIGAVSGGAENAVGGVINPLVPVVGAAGGASSALAEGLGVLSYARQNIFKNCLLEKTRIDHSAITANPDN